VLIFTGIGVTTTVCVMSGIILFWVIYISHIHKKEQIFEMKITSQEIFQNSIERDFEEFNIRGRSLPLYDFLEIDTKLENEESPIIREEIELKGQIIFVRLIIDYLRKYPELEKLFNSSECRDFLKDTNYQQLKKYKNI